MRNRLLATAVCATMLVVSGCLFDTTLNAKGGGEMTLQYRTAKDDTLEKQKANFASPNLTIVDIKVDDKTKDLTAKIKFDDITKLPTAKFFENFTITKAAGKDKDTEVLSGKFVNKRKMAIPDKAVEYFGREVIITLTLPGAVVDTNAPEKKDKTVTWKFPLKDFYSTPEIPFTVTYKKG